MSDRQLYICLIAFLEQDGKAAFKYMAAPIASSEEDARHAAIAEARSEHPEYAPLPIEINSYSFKRSAIERAAREVLGWTPPA